ncbi:MAG: sugar ABC transporter permease, partial [Clostridiales bacterium]|nr:sugar ABC transporter permease [Clostridiales bacterium]
FYMFCSSGRIFKINTDFVGLNQVNAWMRDDITSIDEGEFDKNAYFVFGSMLSLCGAEYHAEQKTFYMLDTSANIYACTGDVFDYRNSERGVLDYSDYLKAEISFESGYGPINRNNDNSSSRNTPPMYLHEGSNRLLIFFTSSNRVCGFDVSDGVDRAFDSALEYNIRAVAYNEDGTELFLCYTDNDNITFNLSVNSPNIYLRGTFKTLSTVFFVLFAVAFVVAIILIGCTLRKGFAAKTKSVLKDLVKQKWVYIILACSLVLLFMFCYYPAISSIALSFTDYTGTNPSKQWNNFKNYVDIFTSLEAIRSFGNMLIFLLADIVTAIVPPLMFAFCLSIIRSKAYSKTARVLLFLPTILPSMATTLIWKFGIFGSSGALNSVLRFLTGDSELTINFLFNNSWSIPSLIFMGFPWVGSYLIFYGAMMNIPSSYFEAAELEGCGLFKRFFKIDIPLITAQIKYVFIMSFIASVQNFGRVYTLTGGAYGTDIPINRMYSYLLAQDYGIAAAYATILFLFLLIATVFNLRMQTVERD